MQESGPIKKVLEEKDQDIEKGKIAIKQALDCYVKVGNSWK